MLRGSWYACERVYTSSMTDAPGAAVAADGPADAYPWLQGSALDIIDSFGEPAAKLIMILDAFLHPERADATHSSALLLGPPQSGKTHLFNILLGCASRWDAETLRTETAVNMGIYAHSAGDGATDAGHCGSGMRTSAAAGDTIGDVGAAACVVPLRHRINIIKGDATTLLHNNAGNAVDSIYRLLAPMLMSLENSDSEQQQPCLHTILLLENLQDAFPSSPDSATAHSELDTDAVRTFIKLLRRVREVNQPVRPGRRVLVLASAQSRDQVVHAVWSRFDSVLQLGIPDSRQRSHQAKHVCTIYRQAPLPPTCRASEAERPQSDRWHVVVAQAVGQAGHGFLLGDVATVTRKCLHAAEMLPATATDEDLQQLFHHLVTDHLPAILTTGAAQSLLTGATGVSVDPFDTFVRGIPGVVAAWRGPLSPAIDAHVLGASKPKDRPEPSPLPEDLLHRLLPATPVVSWAEVAGQDAVKAVVMERIVKPLASADPAAQSKAESVLLYGPPGTGKTLLAKAVATNIGARFISLSIPSILRSGVGESEAILRAAFGIAQCAAPCIVFIDEIQALFVKRDSATESSSRMNALLTSQLLACIDDARASTAGAAAVIVLAATNIPEVLDSALLTPGRFTATAFVSLPDSSGRRQHFTKLLHKFVNTGKVVDAGGVPLCEGNVAQLLDDLTAASAGLSGADIENVVRSSLRQALQSSKAGLTGGISMCSGALPCLSKETLLSNAKGCKASVSPERLAELASWTPPR